MAYHGLSPVERQALVEAINEAWAVIAAVTLLGAVVTAAWLVWSHWREANPGAQLDWGRPAA